MDIKENAIKELDDEINGVKKTIKEQKSKLGKLKMPKTTNMQIRERVSLQRNEIKKLLMNRERYLKELLKRREVVNGFVVQENENDLYVTLCSKNLDKIKMGILQTQLSVNCKREDGWKQNTLEKIREELMSKNFLVEDIVQNFINKYF